MYPHTPREPDRGGKTLISSNTKQREEGRPSYPPILRELEREDPHILLHLRKGREDERRQAGKTLISS